MVHVIDIEGPGPEQVERARQEIARALEVLQADSRRRRRAMVGQCFKYTEQLATDPAQTWPVYVAVTGIDDAGEKLNGWHFQQTVTGDIQVRPDAEVEAGFLQQKCTEIARSEFVGAFNELLTAIARFAHRIPTP